MTFDKILLVKNFLTKEVCDEILSRCKNDLELAPAEIFGGLITKKRKSSVAFIDNIEEIDEKLKTFLEETIVLKGYSVTGLGPYQFTEYKEHEFYDWHTDSGNEVYKDRFCSIVIQLNDGYDEGFLQLKDDHDNIIQMERGVGNLYLFYSNIMHRVIPVKNGIRYSLVNWVSLEPLKNYTKTLI